MTCKECIHYEVCGFEWCDSEDLAFCKDFKEKSRIVELPCKVGDLIYCLSFVNEHYELEIEKILRMEILIGIYTTHMLIKTKKRRIWSSNYNRTWFTDKAKAEAKLKELNGK